MVGSLLTKETRGDTVVQKSPDWDSDVESLTESEGTSSSECQHNVESVALNVMEQDQSGEKGRKLPKVALSCHIAVDMWCQVMHVAW